MAIVLPNRDWIERDWVGAIVEIESFAKTTSGAPIAWCSVRNVQGHNYVGDVNNTRLLGRRVQLQLKWLQVLETVTVP